MLTYIIKFTTIFYLAFYIGMKSFQYQFTIKKHCIFITSSIFTITLTYFFAQHIPPLTYLISLLVIWIWVGYITTAPKLAFVLTVISYCLSFCLHAGISLLIITVSYTLFTNLFSYNIISILSSVLQFILIKSAFQHKRFKNGLSLCKSVIIIDIATIICLALLCILVYLDSDPIYLFGLFTIPLTLAFLIYWWQAQITKAYRRSLELRELESMRTEMTELKLLLLELTEENERLARITHRDNTLISALKNATLKYLSTDYANPAAAMEVRNQLIENINSLSAERARMVDTHKENLARTFDTGISLLDELLREMDEKAQEMNVIFAVHMGTSLENFIPKDISESDLVHTVDDLLKNAFKATASCEKRIVQLQFYKLGKHLVIEVADNGIPFEVKSLVNMGIEKLTTYEDGSGIGLMDIWSTKGKYGATYHLEEYGDATPFSKKISLTLDKKNRYSIRTSRKDEILQASRRADLQVYNFSE